VVVSVVVSVIVSVIVTVVVPVIVAVIVFVAVIVSVIVVIAVLVSVTVSVSVVVATAPTFIFSTQVVVSFARVQDLNLNQVEAKSEDSKHKHSDSYNLGRLKEAFSRLIE
jgi:hypothetical protein